MSRQHNKRSNASSIANCLLDLAHKEGVEMCQLGLMKRIYIVHGFTLALFDRPALDHRFDKVEAWKLGPVIPSIYHELKHFGNNPIDSRCKITKWQISETSKSEFVDESELIEAKLDDAEVKDITRFVWEYYKDFTDGELIRITHKRGTPWYICYKRWENVEIPNHLIKEYYDILVEKIIEHG